MKNLHLIAQSLLSIILFIGCDKLEVVLGEEENPDNPQIEMDTSEVLFTTDGGSNTISFTANEAWTVRAINSRADGWCQIHPTSGFAGDASITVITTPNDTPDDRMASIVIKAGTASETVKVIQTQKDALIISKKDIVISDEGGIISFELQTNVDFKVSEPDVDWMRAVTTRGLTPHTLSYTVDTNVSYDSRVAKIVVADTKNNKSEIITITQAQKDAIIIAKTQYNVDSKGEQIQIDVNSNVDFDIEISNDWIKQSATRSLHCNLLTFEIQQNTDKAERYGFVKFISEDGAIMQTVDINQSCANGNIEDIENGDINKW